MAKKIINDGLWNNVKDAVNSNFDELYSTVDSIAETTVSEDQLEQGLAGKIDDFEKGVPGGVATFEQVDSKVSSTNGVSIDLNILEKLTIPGGGVLSKSANGRGNIDGKDLAELTDLEGLATSGSVQAARSTANSALAKSEVAQDDIDNIETVQLPNKLDKINGVAQGLTVNGSLKIPSLSGNGQLEKNANDEVLIDGKRIDVSDKAYSSTNYTGKGKVFLKKNMQTILNYDSLLGSPFRLLRTDTPTVEATQLTGNPEYIVLNTTTNRIYGYSGGKYYTNWSGALFPIANYISAGLPIENKVYFGLEVGDVNKFYKYASGTFTIYNKDSAGAPTKTANVITQSMIAADNTIYIVEYDFIAETAISLSSNSLFEFRGGSINLYGQYLQGNDLRNVKNLVSTTNTRLLLKGFNGNILHLSPQSTIPLTIDVFDYIRTTDWVAENSAFCINLNNVIDRIYTAFNSTINHTTRKLNISLPNLVVGQYMINKTLLIKYNVDIDFNNNTLFIAAAFTGNNAFEWESFDEGNNKNNVRGSIKNINAVVTANSTVKTIFDLTNFSSSIENIKLNMNNNTAYVFLQPVGTPRSSYSDMKIIRNVIVGNSGIDRSQPSSILAYGDGCIIERCVLGHLMIAYSNSYTIKGCLNDSYTLFNTTVDFSGSYWEVGQFKIWNSKVKFDCGKLQSDSRNWYVGDYMEIDTANVRSHVINILKNKIYTTNTTDVFITEAESVIQFGEALRYEMIYWGYLNGNLNRFINKAPRTKIVGLKNFVAYNRHFANNNNSVVFGRQPLVNDDLNPEIVSRDITELSANLLNSTIGHSAANINYGAAFAGVNWSSGISIVVKLFLCLDHKRKLIYHDSPRLTINSATVANQYFFPSINFSPIEYTKIPDFQIIIGLIMGGVKYVGYANIVDASRAFKYNSTFDELTSLSTTNSIPVTEYIGKSYIPGIDYRHSYGNFIQSNSEYDSLVNNEFNTCLKIERISDINIRAYLTALPTRGTWTTGDEVMINNTIYRYVGNIWINNSDIFTAPNGTKYRITVSNEGNLITTAL